MSTWKAKYIEQCSRLRSNDAVEKVDLSGITIFIVPNFASDDECDYLSALVMRNLHKSQIHGDAPASNVRTSRTAPIGHLTDDVIGQMDDRICTLLGVSGAHGERMQGQAYGAGDFFKPHLDTFPTTAPYWKVQDRIGGQRTWTAMIYLNSCSAGGRTLFPRSNFAVLPEKGTLCAWCNVDADGITNPFALHASEPLRDVSKIVVTKWFREREIDRNYVREIAGARREQTNQSDKP